MNICSKLSFALLLLLSSSEHEVHATTTSKKYGYLLNGADWKYDPDTKCSSTHQSPIDLRGQLSNDPFRMADGTDLVNSYKDIEKSTVTYSKNKVSLTIPSGEPADNYISSQHAVDTYNAFKFYTATHIEFRGRSEHTVDGRRFDLEMQIIHKHNPDLGKRRLQEKTSDYQGTVPPDTAAVSIFFDGSATNVNADEQEAVWNFFDSLELDSGATADADGNIELAKDKAVPFGKLMNQISLSNRWTYSGSLSEPPCTVGRLYHVVEGAQPISKVHLKQFLDLMTTEQVDYLDKTGAEQVADDSAEPKKRALSETGNYRIPNKLDYHNVRYMRADIDDDESTDPTTTMYALLIIIGILCAVALILGYCACKLMTNTDTVKAAEDDNHVEMASARSSARSSARK